MNDKTSNDLYGEDKTLNEFINHSNDSNLYLVVTMSTKVQKRSKNI